MDSVVIKSLLVLRIAAQSSPPIRRYIEKAVNAMLDEIVAAMACGDRVELRDFGTFVVKVRKARVGRNPKTGAQVHVPAKVRPAFKPGKEIRKRLNADGQTGCAIAISKPVPHTKMIDCVGRKQSA